MKTNKKEIENYTKEKLENEIRTMRQLINKTSFSPRDVLYLNMLLSEEDRREEIK